MCVCVCVWTMGPVVGWSDPKNFVTEYALVPDFWEQTPPPRLVPKLSEIIEQYLRH